ncbi:MAG: amidohydrolase family protein [Acidimicrobiia bacterium]
MFDLVVRGATLVDGTGAPSRRADVAVADGRVAEVGAVEGRGRRELDADGLMVAPGFVDPHTHYDAQLFWDPSASPSSVHGVTSVIGGNCGFTLAPLHAEDADYLRRMMAKVEGMPLAALEQGVDWNWETFGDYLGRLDGAIAVNAGFLVGHCALRRYVMGAEAVGREATDAEVAAMVTELHAAIDAGGLGFSTTLSKTHSDGDGQPVASRWASEAEVLALCAAVGEHEGTTLEGILDGDLDPFDDDEIDLLARMSAAGNRPLNWNVLTVDSRVPQRVPRQLLAGDRAVELGGRVVALTMPVLVPMNMSFLTYCALFMLPGWGEVMGLPVGERMQRLSDPETRAWMNARANSDEAGVFRRLADWENYVLGDTYSVGNEGLKGRTVKDVAAERGSDAFATLLDIVIADDLRTILWPIAPDGDPASWELRKSVWEDDRAMLGGSDAGAHLDRMCGAPYTTRFLGDMLRGRQLISVEDAVRMITSDPADLFGLRDRGRVRPGAHADLVVFDPETIGAGHATLVADLPGGSARLTSEALGIEHVFVNGVETVTGNQATGAVPGTILRSGRDTATVPTR